MDFPLQNVGAAETAAKPVNTGTYDMRDFLFPKRLTIAMWDQSYLTRHIKGESFEDYDRVLDQVKAIGYNTLRLDPMPYMIDTDNIDRLYSWQDGPRFMPWSPGRGGSAPHLRDMIECVDKIKQRGLYYTLSTWGGTRPDGPHPKNLTEGADIWGEFLTAWQRLQGFEGLVYVDIANEFPYFIADYVENLKQQTGFDWHCGQPFPPEVKQLIEQDMNTALSKLQRAFPQLRFTCSIHGDPRWLACRLQLDCFDVHFYADADPRWRDRTCFDKMFYTMYNDDTHYKDFSDRCNITVESVGPMLRAMQRSKLALFADWAARDGIPLTTSESWSSWFYTDHPDLNWDWLNKWAAWTVKDAIEYKMWGWCAHNYLQPQFKNFWDTAYHRALTDEFINS